MVYVLAMALIVLNTAWLLLTALTLPGNWLMVASAVLLAWWQRDAHMFSPWTLVAILILAAAGEILEFITSSVGVRRAGGTKKGGLGAILGGFAGLVGGSFLIPIPILGSLLGACAGAFAGAMLLEKHSGRSIKDAARSGTAAAQGRFLGTVYKSICGVLIWIIIAVAAFWP